MSTHYHAYMEASTLSEWVPLITSTVLVIVTGWYAYLTKHLADSSERAASEAMKAAIASQQSAAIAAAGADVNFWVGPIMGMENVEGPEAYRMSLIGVSIEGSGANVFVHGAYLSGVRRPADSGGTMPVDVNQELQLRRQSRGAWVTISEPQRLHKGERWEGRLPQAVNQEQIASMELEVFYSFDGGPGVSQIDVKYEGEPGKHYENENIWRHVSHLAAGLVEFARSALVEGRLSVVPVRVGVEMARAEWEKGKQRRRCNG